ncbi:hypothetical protein DPMN_078631 [Dreissena polymorpha]|uniref:Uncharacterized protein n=1 Tax=Dreissena polymorpha TaxID=45954 RepID=A0A9D4BQF1_DREPO|nr:hypothetical protein DPMN_078631 [Dreissena polymorpha]
MGINTALSFTAATRKKARLFGCIKELQLYYKAQATLYFSHCATTRDSPNCRGVFGSHLATINH